MKSLSLHQTPLSWWVDVYTSVPPQTYRLGPFNSHEEAKISRGDHVKALYHKNARYISALIKER